MHCLASRNRYTLLLMFNNQRVLHSNSLVMRSHTRTKKFTVEVVENAQGLVINLRETERIKGVNARVMIPANDPSEITALIELLREARDKASEI